MEVGDAKVRDEDIYQCIFNVKAIRNNMRHDVAHGDYTYELLFGNFETIYQKNNL